MRLDDLINSTGQWLKGTGPYAHIVTSSRIRLARNLASFPFPNKSDKKELEEVLATVEKAFNQIEYFKDSTLFRINEIDSVDRQFLVERHLMSHEHASNPDGKGLIVSKEEILSIMINEE